MVCECVDVYECYDDDVVCDGVCAVTVYEYLDGEWGEYGDDGKVVSWV